ncbi:MAG: SpoIIE family protein phosphatase [Verrucomicrobia bacterium]|nr:SpoIIE family protein phosphatase [Verrucomicrobiota bacterium]
MEDRSGTTLTDKDLERSVTLYKGLLEVSRLISSITDMDELLAAILDVARRVMAAEASSLFLVDEKTGDLELTIARGKRPAAAASLPIKVPRGKGIAGWVRQRRQSLLVEHAYDDPRFYPEMDRSTGFITRSLIAVPLFQDAQDIGVLEVLNPLGKPAFDDLDLEGFQAYGDLVATSIQKLRLIKREGERRQWEKDLVLATEIQHSFLPDVLPSTELLSLAAHYRPAKDIAGDFYDVFERDPGEFYFVVGDVSGKGVSAALMMAQALSMLRLIVHSGMSPGAALARWNGRICRRTVRGMFITAILGRIRPEQGLLDFAAAGHVGPLLRQANLEIRAPAIAAAPPLGIVSDLEFPVNQIKLLPGDQAIFYTDGLVESFNAAREPFSLDRVRALLARPYGRGGAEILDALMTEEAIHRGKVPPHDDLTILAIGLK